MFVEVLNPEKNCSHRLYCICNNRKLLDERFMSLLHGQHVSILEVATWEQTTFFFELFLVHIACYPPLILNCLIVFLRNKIDSTYKKILKANWGGIKSSPFNSPVVSSTFLQPKHRPPTKHNHQYSSNLKIKKVNSLFSIAIVSLGWILHLLYPSASEEQRCHRWEGKTN